MLNMLVKDGLISEYIFVHVPATLTDLQGSEQVSLQINIENTQLFLFNIVKKYLC